MADFLLVIKIHYFFRNFPYVLFYGCLKKLGFKNKNSAWKILAEEDVLDGRK